jgi:hypothetical protein
MKPTKVLTSFVFKAALLALLFGAVDAAPAAPHKPHSEHPAVPTNIQKGPKPVPLKTAKIDGLTVAVNTTGAAPDPAAVKAPRALVPRAITNVKGTVLIFARDALSAYSASSGLAGYGIPYQVVTVPSTGITLPALSTSATAGNYGAIVVVSEVSYDYGALGFQSALTAAQWQTIYQYQVDFGVRLVRLDVYPSADSGTSAIGGCCNTGVEQLISVSSTTNFPTSGLKT